jgi:hypothetical protein
VTAHANLGVSGKGRTFKTSTLHLVNTPPAYISLVFSAYNKSSDDRLAVGINFEDATSLEQNPNPLVADAM